MNRLALILGLGVLLVGSDALAASRWFKNCQGAPPTTLNPSSTLGNTTMSLSPGDFACTNMLDTTASAADTGILGISSCNHIDVQFYPDSDGDGVASGATINVRMCPPGASPTANACWVAENLTLDGVPATNTEAIYGLAGTSLYIATAAYAAPTEPVRAVVMCRGPLP